MRSKLGTTAGSLAQQLLAALATEGCTSHITAVFWTRFNVAYSWFARRALAGF
jgi:hypothetical protein